MTYSEIENVVSALPLVEKRVLYQFLAEQLSAPSAASSPTNGHSVLDIPTVELGAMLRPWDDDADLLDEMLQGRQ